MSATSKVAVGRPAPDFKATAVVDGSLKEVSLDAYTSAKHWLILVFFPKAWSFICPTEIKAFSARLEEFLYVRQCAVIFVSTDSEYCLKAWNATSESEGGLGTVHIPLVSDTTHALSRDYGVLIEDQGVAQRALFIIDPKGTVRAITINDADVGRSVDETQRILDALRFKDEFGEGCPIDWKQGDKGVVVQTPIEGPVQVGRTPITSMPKSWASWARPKLYRASSSHSEFSVNSAAVMSNRSASLRGSVSGPAGHYRHVSAGTYTPPTVDISPGLVAPMNSSYFPAVGNDVAGSTDEAEELRRRTKRAQDIQHLFAVGVAN